MIRRTVSRRRRGLRLVPTIQGLEGRLALSAVGPAPAPRAAVAAAVAAPEFPLRFEKFTALFQGSYMTGKARQPGFASQLYMTGGGNTSAFHHADIQVAIYQADDPSLPAVGQANLIPKGLGTGGNVMLIDLEAVPGRVDRAGRPNLFTWKLNHSSGGQFTNGEGSGTVQLFYFPSRKVPHGATAAGRLGFALRGDLGLDGVSNIVF